MWLCTHKNKPKPKHTECKPHFDISTIAKIPFKKKKNSPSRLQQEIWEARLRVSPGLCTTSEMGIGWKVATCWAWAGLCRGGRQPCSRWAARGRPAASPSHRPKNHIPALAAELFPPRELATCLPGLQQPSHRSRLVLAQGNGGDTEAGKGAASLAGGEGRLVLNQAGGASPAPPAAPPERQRLLGGTFQPARGSICQRRLPAIPFDTQTLSTPKPFRLLWNPQSCQARQQDRGCAVSSRL